MTGHRRVRDDRDSDDWAALFRPRGGSIGCPPPELVQGARVGALPPDLQEVISTHTAACVVCTTLGESLESFPAASPTPEELRRIEGRIRGSLTAAPRRPVRRRLWRAAAAIVLTASGSWLAYRWSMSGAGESPAPSPAGHPPSVFALDRAPLLPPTPTDSISSAERVDLSAALEPYREGEFREAKRRLTAYVAKYPDRPEGHFYLGVSELVLFSNASAVAALETAEQLAAGRADLAREVAWYLALAYRRTGEKDGAWDRLARLCRDPRGGSLRACDGLAELAQSVHLHGLITDIDGRPIPAATVREHSTHGTSELGFSAPTHFGATTDASGAYGVDGIPWSASARLIVRATAFGYFTATASVPSTPDAQVDFTLYPWRHIRAGEVVRGITRDHPMCELSTEPCQRYALTVPQSGTLDISVSTRDRADTDLYVETPDGKVYGPGPSAPLQLSFPTAGGGTFQIRVLSFDQPREFELTTRIR
jgi:hypothetical protein